MLLDWWRRWRRARLLRRAPLDAELFAAAVAATPTARGLDASGREKLRELVTIFLAEKHLQGAGGFVLEDRHRYRVAVQACVLVLGLGIDAYNGWSSIYVYPDTFRRRPHHYQELGDGIWTSGGEPMAGEAMTGGAVALSWSDAESGSAERDGYNPVIHELAHKLDMLDGDANGTPPLPPDIEPARWKRAFQEAFERFCDDVDAGRDTRIDPYAAESPAEFFAVLSESFFEQPGDVAAEMPEVFDLLVRYYRQDPRRDVR